jgi:predicted ATPase
VAASYGSAATLRAAMAGSVESVRVENFLNHHNLKVDLCPGVNFITGENGSGKSAILTALCVALVRRHHTHNRHVTSPPLWPRRGGPAP